MGLQPGIRPSMAGFPHTSGQMPAPQTHPLALLSYKALPEQGSPSTSAHLISHPCSPSLFPSLFLARAFELSDANTKRLGDRTVQSTRLLCLPEPEASSQQLASVPNEYRSLCGYEVQEHPDSFQVPSALDFLICEEVGGAAFQGYHESHV